MRTIVQLTSVNLCTADSERSMAANDQSGLSFLMHLGLPKAIEKGSCDEHLCLRADAERRRVLLGINPLGIQNREKRAYCTFGCRLTADVNKMNPRSSQRHSIHTESAPTQHVA